MKPKAINLLVIEEEHTNFLIRIVQQGQRYGRDFGLENIWPDPLVEFYDMRHPHSVFGQFVSRYNLSTLIERGPQGLWLDTGSDDWSVSESNMRKVYVWLLMFRLDQGEHIIARCTGEPVWEPV